MTLRDSAGEVSDIRSVCSFGNESLNVQIAQLTGGRRAWTLGHETLSLLSLRERNDIADTAGTAQDCHQTVETERDTAVRRSSVRECLEHVPEALCHDILRDLQHIFENLLLHGGLMDTDTTATQFHTVQHDIVVLAAHALRIAVQIGH